MTTRRKHPEDDVQLGVVQYLKLLENQGKLTFFAVPNGGYRREREASIMKRLGVRAGVPDLIILSVGKMFGLEVKAPGKKPSDNQLLWKDLINFHGYGWEVIDDAGNLPGILREWGILPKAEAAE